MIPPDGSVHRNPITAVAEIENIQGQIRMIPDAGDVESDVESRVHILDDLRNSSLPRDLPSDILAQDDFRGNVDVLG